jgi:hypothetical protein
MRNSSSLLAALVLATATATLAIGCADSSDLTSETSGDASLAGKFDVWQSQTGQWYFHLKAGNGQILLTSESYTTRTSAIAGVLAAETDGVDPAAYQLAAAVHGYDVDLVAGNHQIVASTEVYSDKSNATRAITTCADAVTSYLDQRERETTGARVAVETGASGELHFNYYAQNGQVVLTSQTYTTEAAALDGAFAVQGAFASAYIVAANSAGGYYFNVLSPNGQVIGTSQQYTTKESAQAGAAAVQKLAPTISVL